MKTSNNFIRRNRVARFGFISLLVISSLTVITSRVGIAGGDVEQRIAEFWRRVDALQPADYLLSADLGQWALNVIERNPRARTTVADFRVSTAGMQAAMDRAGLAPPMPTPTPITTPTPTPVLPPGTYALGQSVSFTSGWKLTAQSCAEQAPGYNKPDAGMRLFTCFVRFDNGASVTIRASKFDFVLQDSTGVRRDPVFGYIDRNDVFNSGDVAPGGVLAGTITFQAPIGDTRLLLIYSTYGLSQVTYVATPGPLLIGSSPPVLTAGTNPLGQSVIFTSGWKLTAQSCAEQAPGYNQPDPGMRLFTCFVRFDNGASVTIRASKFDFVLQDSTGVRRDPVFGYIDRNDAFNSGDVTPGGVLAGTITFQAPIGDTRLLLIYSKYGLSQVTYRIY